jgi:hypothetical protein
VVSRIPRAPLLRGAFSLLLAASCTAARAALPLPFAAEFQGRKSVFLVDASARAVLELRASPTHARYSVVATVSWLGLSRRFEDCAVVRSDAGGRIVALEFVHLDHGDPALDVHTTFDWPARRAVTRLGGDREVVAEIAAPAWDPMSFQLALAGVASRRRSGDVETHTVVERGVAKTHRVVYEGPSASPWPPMAAEVFAVRSTKDGGGTTGMLLDPRRGWQPLRIVVADVTLDATTLRPPPPSLPADEVPQCPLRTSR